MFNKYKLAEKISQKNPEDMLNNAMQLQLKFELILTYNKAGMDN